MARQDSMTIDEWKERNERERGWVERKTQNDFFYPQGEQNCTQFEGTRVIF